MESDAVPNFVGMVVDRIEMNDLPGGSFNHVIHFADGSICRMYYNQQCCEYCELLEEPHNLDRFVGKIVSFAAIHESDPDNPNDDDHWIITYSFGMVNGEFVKFRYYQNATEDSCYSPDVLFEMLTLEQQKEKERKEAEEAEERSKWIWVKNPDYDPSKEWFANAKFHQADGPMPAGSIRIPLSTMDTTIPKGGSGPMNLRTDKCVRIDQT